MPPGFRFLATRTAVFLLVLSTLVHALVMLPSVGLAQKSKPASGSVDPALPRLLPGTIEHGDTKLPAPVIEMREAILAAVESGKIEDLKVAIELNEIKPFFGDGDGADPIARLRRHSTDPDGRDVLAAIGAILGAGYTTTVAGRDIENNRIYVWPHFAETGVNGLSADREAELLRIVPEPHLTRSKAAGRYKYWRLGIGADGTWHFLQNEGGGEPK